jgi:hypothetical protein
VEGKRFHRQRRSATPTDVFSPRAMSVWIPVEAAPFNRALEICVVEGQGVQAFSFRCQRVENGWKSLDTDELLDLFPTHWRDW